MVLVPEDKIMLKTFLDSYLFNNKDNIKQVGSNAEVELIVRPECNQKCTYCYITKYGKELYPIENRVDNIQILKNIKILLDYFYENKCFVKNWELFAGDLFYDDLFFDIMELFYNYFKKIKNNYSEIYKNITNEREYFKNADHNCICIPCNFSFCHNDNKIQKFVEIYDKLMSVDTEIVLSYSTDGLYAIDNREKNLTTNQEFYDKVFKFCADFGYNCHPMIAPENIDNAIDNYEWWKKMYKKYFSSYNQIMPCMLEVRNEGWTQEKINKYIEFLEYLIQDRLKIYNNNIEIFTKMLFTNSLDELKDMKEYIRGPFNMDPLTFRPTNKDQNEISCSLGHSLCINCAHLTLIPCHRLAYSIFEGGQFKIENNKIVDIEPLEGINAYLNQMFINRPFEIGCQTCDNRFFCIQGCHGSQYETNGDPNTPISSVCNLLQTKTNYLLKRYHELGVFDILFLDKEDLLININKKRTLDLLIRKGYHEYKQYLDN